jgi:hypothetical protein
MLGLDRLSFPGLDQVAGSITLPLWVVAAAAALFIYLLLAMRRVAPGVVIGSVAGIGLLAVAAATLYTFSNRFNRDEERRALDRRLLQLTASTFASGSTLACLDADFSETVEDSCEKMIFASPDMVAAAFAFVHARLLLLIDGLNFASRHEAAYETKLAALRRGIEVDRFGFVAQVLKIREGCNSARCDALALLRDADRIRSNLNERTFDELVARNAPTWPQQVRSSGTPTAAAIPRPPASAARESNVPSSSSIPPVSIMVESAPPAEPPVGAPAPRRPAAPPRTAQPRTQQTNPPDSPPPLQLGPPSNGNAARGP